MALAIFRASFSVMPGTLPNSDLRSVMLARRVKSTAVLLLIFSPFQPSLTDDRTYYPLSPWRPFCLVC